MKKFKVYIEETLAQGFDVEAESVAQAMEIAEKKYWDCEFVLENSEVHARRIQVCDGPDGKALSEWEEF